MDSIGLMSEVDQLFHARNPLFILRQFLGVTYNRMRLLMERNTFLSSLLYNLRFIMNVLFVKDSFGLVFMMTFLMRDVDELFHGVQALFMFLTFTVRQPHSTWAPLAKFFLFQFHFRLVTHRHSAAPGRKYVFAMDMAYHAFEWCLFFVNFYQWPPPTLSPVHVLAQSFQALTLLYHSYVIWTFVRWIKLTLPIVQLVSAQPEDGAGHLLSPAMSRLLLSLLEAQGGNVPLLRLLERVLRLQERVRNLAQILENQQLQVGDAGAAIVPVVAAAAAGQQQLLNVLRPGPRRSVALPLGASGLGAGSTAPPHVRRERAAERPSGAYADDHRELQELRTGESSETTGRAELPPHGPHYEAPM